MNLVFAQPVGCGVDGQERTERPSFWPVAVYAASCTIGGAATGTVLGLLGVASRAVLPTAAVAATAIAVACVATWAAMRRTVAPLPQRQAQVPRRWLNFRHRSSTAAAFGLMIGAGFLTYLHHATAYTAAAVVLLAPNLAVAVGLGAVYGAVRGLMLVLAWVLSAGTVGSRRGRAFAQLGVLHGPLTLVSIAAVAMAVSNVQ